MAFEDLKIGNFINVNQAEGMDVAHLKLSLTTLAKWHATTAVLLLKVVVQNFIEFKIIVSLYSNPKCFNGTQESCTKTQKQ